MHFINAFEGSCHLFVQSPVNLFQIPVIIVGVLHLFEIGYGDSAGICQKIGQHNDPFIKEDFIGVRGCWSVCQFAGNLATQLVCIFFSDNVFQR